MRLGKIRAPYYRIVVADARTKREGRVIETIGKYHPKQEPSLIEVDSERARYWLSVGAQPTEPVAAILKLTGDWQAHKGLPAPEHGVRTAAPKTDRKAVFEAVVKETMDAAEKPAKKTAPAKKAAPAKTAAKKTAEAPADDTAPADEAAAPVDEAAAPVDEAAAPVDEAAAPADEAAAPADEAAAPADEAAAPVDDAVAEAPAAEAEAAAEQATAAEEAVAEPAAEEAGE
jgi:small subunit ribosomal protein S16